LHRDDTRDSATKSESTIIVFEDITDSRPRIGFYGTGVMGHAMVRRLLQGGYRVSVWNRTPDKYTDLVNEGASAPGTPAAVAEQSDILIAMLMEPAHLDAILEGPQGILAGVQAGSIFIDMGTNPPRNAQRLAERFASHSVASLDAPVRGGVRGAVDGSLLIMAGGDDETYLRALPVLQAMGTKIVHVGGSGSGQIAKACHQLVVAVTIEAVAEALALAQSFGAEQARVREVLLAGQATSPVLERQGARMLARDWTPGRPIKHYVKDRANVADALAGTGLTLPLAHAVFERIAGFVESGNGELDEAALYMLLDAAP
jgi:2-hydroxy-3-oxopropionate reductase